MKVRDSIASTLGLTRAEMIVVAALLLFFMLGLILRGSGAIRETTDRARTDSSERFNDAQVDSLLREAEALEAFLAETAAAGVPSGREQETRLSGRQRGTSQIVFSHASVTELESIPGISSVLAERLVEFRNSHRGKVERFRDFLDVKGIGQKRMETLQQHLVLE